MPPSDLEFGVQAFDAIADSAKLEEAEDDADYVHIRVQQRNGKKCLTTVQGLPAKYDYNRILKALKKEFCCNGTVVEDGETGKVIQLQGDQRKHVSDFIVKESLVKKDMLKIHGF